MGILVIRAMAWEVGSQQISADHPTATPAEMNAAGEVVLAPAGGPRKAVFQVLGERVEEDMTGGTVGV